MLLTIIILVAILAVLVFVHELGHFLVAKLTKTQVDEFAIGFPPRIFARKFGETTYAVNAIPFGGYVKMPGEDGADETLVNNPRVFSNKPRYVQSIILLGGVVFNMIFAWLLVVGIFTTGIPASESFTDRYSQYVTETTNDYSVVALPVHLAIKEGSIFTYHLTQDTFRAFGKLIAGNAALEELAGPVGLGKVVDSARTFGATNVILLMAFISINLAVLNIIPFPALDGGRLLILILESVIRRKIKPSILTWINSIGFFLLILLMIVITISDIGKLI